MDLHRLSIKTTREMIETGKLSAYELRDYYVNRISKYGDRMNPFITVCLDAPIKEELKDKPLFGICFSMKDIYLTSGIRTTAGSRVLSDFTPSYDSTVYRRLTDAGAVLIGKTICDPWGFGSSTEHCAYGPAKNPWNSDYVPGGSSGGEAVSIASGMSAFGIGEDTGGSIRQPASFCGIVGLKVTYGLVSRYGAIAYASSLDTVGPMCKSVEDCALVLSVVAGRDTRDAVTAGIDENIDYSKDLSEKPSKIKIGVPKEFFSDSIDPDVGECIEYTLRKMESLGYEIVDVSLPMTKYAVSTYYLIAMCEASSNLARYDGIRFGNTRDAFGDEEKRRIMLGSYALSAGYYDEYYKKACKVRTLIREDFKRVLEEVDCLIAPVSPTPPFKFGEKISDPLQMYLSDVFTVSPSLAGVPCLALPSGFTKKGLPVGFQLIGKHFDEELLLRIGYGYEKAIGGFALPEDKVLDGCAEQG